MDYYETMLQGSFSDAVYSGSGLRNGWLRLTNGRKFKTTGWKFRVSVHPEDVSSAWNIIVPFLMRQGDHFKAKAASPQLINLFSSPAHSQAGKMITIYATGAGSFEAWNKIVCDLEKELLSRGIRPGAVVKSDRLIKGSAYISYRHDGGKRPFSFDEIKSASDDYEYNPRKLPDPFAHLNIAV